MIKEIKGFECCFCKKGIKETKTDPIDINVVFNEDMIKKTGSFQNFYAHFDCFHATLHKDIKGYFVNDD
jgi:hypothetical protein